MHGARAPDAWAAALGAIARIEDGAEPAALMPRVDVSALPAPVASLALMLQDMAAGVVQLVRRQERVNRTFLRWHMLNTGLVMHAQRRIHSLTGELDIERLRVTQLDANVAEQAAEIGSLHGTVTGLECDVAAGAERATRLEAAIAQHAQQLAESRAHLAQHAASLAALRRVDARKDLLLDLGLGLFSLLFARADLVRAPLHMLARAVFGTHRVVASTGARVRARLGLLPRMLVRLAQVVVFATMYGSLHRVARLLGAYALPASESVVGTLRARLEQHAEQLHALWRSASAAAGLVLGWRASSLAALGDAPRDERERL